MNDNRHPEPDPDWHSMDSQEVLSELKADENGLSDDEAARRLESHGPNELPSGPRQSALQRLIKQFHNLLIYILLVAAVLTAFLQEWLDMSVVLGVVVINAIVGFIQEGKAEKAMESIRQMLSPKATVLRNGRQREIEAAELVPGDIVLLESGDRVPADLRVLQAGHAEVDESFLTGESEPVDKRTEPVDDDEELGDRQSMAYSGAIITSGELRGVVVATGLKAEIGRISEMVSQVESVETPLIRRIDSFGRWLSLAIVLLSLAIFAIGYWLRGLPAVEMFMAVVSLAVAAIPEGLPAIMTITLALGVQSMARRNAIVRRLPAVETLGSVTVACADKTGTLTRNEMTVAKVALADQLITVTGIGYQPEGSLEVDGEEISPEDYPGLIRLVRAGTLCNQARLEQQDGSKWTVEGTPTDGSILVLARKAGLEPEQEEDQHPRQDSIPFESERRFMATLNRDSEGNAMIHVKGAPERILEMCSSQLRGEQSEDLDRELWLEREEELARQGHRVLAIAEKPARSENLEPGEFKDLTILGMVGIIDPPRDEAIYAVEQCHNAGISVKMITGDHLLTAGSIAGKMGIGDGRRAIVGKDLEEAEGEELARLVMENDVFARSSPEHKLKIVKALQGESQIVAMTGDGVNDAPSLKRADVGVAMGIKGSEAAREASEIVLADDNFATIERAVEEGRTIYDNLLKAILFLLPTNGAQSLVVICSALFFFDAMATTPVQILWINMVTAVTLALALAFEPSEEMIMQRPPKPPDQPILTTFLVWRIVLVSIIIAGAAVTMFLRYRDAVAIETARSITVNTIVCGQVFYLFSNRFFERSSFSLGGLLGNKKILLSIGILMILQAFFTYWRPAQRLFGTGPVGAGQWLWILVAGLAVFVVVEPEKAFFRWRHQ